MYIYVYCATRATQKSLSIHIEVNHEGYLIMSHLAKSRCVKYFIVNVLPKWFARTRVRSIYLRSPKTVR